MSRNYWYGFGEIEENYLTEYKAKNGGTTTEPELAETDNTGNPIKTCTFKTVDVEVSDSKAALFFHGLGHVIHQNNSEQEKVIDYDNKARSIFKPQKKNGKFKPAPEDSREVNESHKNKPY